MALVRAWGCILKPEGRAVIEDPSQSKLLSPASYWELAIKISIGKYALKSSYDDLLRQSTANQGFEILPILPSHTAVLLKLPHHHRDPFDRLLVAQSIAEGVPIISADPALDAYGVTRRW